MEKIKFETIESQNILKIAYLQNVRELFVVFKYSPDTTYVYKAVPNNVWLAFRRASSKGVYHKEHILNKYEVQKRISSQTRG